MPEQLRFSLLGHPVSHSVSPAMCTAAFAALGLPYIYTAVDVANEIQLERVVRDLRAGVFAGCNVTLPYKRAAFGLADVRAPSAEEAGVANVLTVNGYHRVVAHNTDAEALSADLGAALGDRPRQLAAVIGAGGAGLAALAACRRLGFKVICVTSRSWTNTETMFDSPSGQLARSLGALPAPWPSAVGPIESGHMSQALRLQWGDLVGNADCVIQATSAGMVGAGPGEDVASVVNWDKLPRHAIMYDVVYNPRLTPFLRRAHEQGLCAMDGLGMLVRQAAMSIHLWTGKTPPLDRMQAAAEEALAARTNKR